jgi:hypothetical protein
MSKGLTVTSDVLKCVKMVAAGETDEIGSGRESAPTEHPGYAFLTTDDAPLPLSPRVGSMYQSATTSRSPKPSCRLRVLLEPEKLEFGSVI